jgi:hypothetical protein
VRDARFVALSAHGKQPFKPLQHLIFRIRSAPARALHWRMRVMEVAAVMMLAAVVFGICQQFDRQTW